VPESGRGVAPECGRKKRWLPDPAETIDHTTSRRTGPRAWLRALEEAAAAGLIPGFNATTRAIVTVLAGRMNFDTGHARYVMQDVMERTGLGKTAVTNHVKMLRAGGWLAWVEHGSLRNALRGLGGYARTATVYAATIPPVYDAHAGNVLIGTGYTARAVIDHRGTAAVDTAGTTPVENSGDASTRTPSLWVVKEVGQCQVVGGKDSSTADAAASEITRPRKKRRHTVTGYKITGERIERARQLAKSVRPRVNWVQGASHDQLSWVFLDLVARDWHEGRIVAWLGRLGQEIGAPRWRPRFPHRVIAAALRRQDEADARLAQNGPTPGATRPANAPTAEFAAAARRVAERYAPTDIVDYPSVAESPENIHDRGILHDVAAADLGIVRSLIEHLGRDEALRIAGSDAVRAYDAARERDLVYGITA